MNENFRNDVDRALKSAHDVLGSLDTGDVRELPTSDQVNFALAQATIAVAYSLRRMADIQDKRHYRAGT
jgi:hypothetical protein